MVLVMVLVGLYKYSLLCAVFLLCWYVMSANVNSNLNLGCS